MTHQPLPHERPDAHLPGAFAVPPAQVTSRQARRDAARRGVRLATVGLGAAALFGTGAVVAVVASGHDTAEAATDSANSSQSSTRSSTRSGTDEDSENWGSSRGSDSDDSDQDDTSARSTTSSRTTVKAPAAAPQAPAAAAQAPVAATHTS